MAVAEEAVEAASEEEEEVAKKEQVEETAEVAKEGVEMEEESYDGAD